MNRHAFLPPPAVEAGESPQRHGQTPVLGAGLVTLQLMSLLQELLANS